MEDRFRITIREKFKQTKPGRHLAPTDIFAFKDDKKLCVVEYFREYLDRTKQYRKDHSQLLLSYTKPPCI